MRALLFTFLTCSLLFFTAHAFAWQIHVPRIQHIVQYLPWQRQLAIPRFILDAQHPWIEANKSRVERLPNATEALCSLDSPIRPGNGTRNDVDFTYPPDFYHYLEVDNNRAGVDRPGWLNAHQRLSEILACPAALRDVQNFKIEIWVHDYERQTPPAVLPDIFVKTLSSMPNLEKLEWNTWDHGTDIFKETFQAANLTLPSVKHLKPAMYTEWLVDMCPNLTILESGSSLTTADYWRWTLQGEPREALVEAAGRSPNLTCFSMTGEWTVELLQSLLDHAPNITTLTMPGLLQDHHIYNYDSFAYGQDITVGDLLRNYVAVLARFPGLTHLALPDSSQLGVGFTGGPECGNVYFGKEGREYGRQVSEQEARAAELAAEIVLEKLDRLETLRVGSHWAELSRGGDGNLSARWPWTGRMREWTYEVWPEVDDGWES